MAGITETLDLDISEALGRVSELEDAVKGAVGAGSQVSAAGGEAFTPLAKGADEAASSISGQLTPALGALKGPLSSIGGEAASSFGALGSAAAGAAGPIGLVVGGLTAAIGVAKQGVEAFSDLADTTRNVQNVTGASADEAQRFIEALDFMGASTDTTTTALFRLGRQIEDGTSKLDEYGVATVRSADGSVDLLGTFYNVADAVAAATSGTQRAAIAFAAFGRQGLGLLEVLKKGGAGLRELGKDGAQLSQAQIDQEQRLSIATAQLKDTFSDLAVSIGAEVVPALEKAVGAANKTVTAIQEMDDGARSLTTGGGFRDAVKAGDVFGTIYGGVGLTVRQVTAALTGNADALDNVNNSQDATERSIARLDAAIERDLALVAARKGGLSELQKVIEGFNDELDRLFDKNLGAARASAGFQTAIEKFKDSVKEGGKSIDQTTAAGRANVQAIEDVFRTASAEVDDFIARGLIPAADRTEAIRQRMQAVGDTVTGPVHDAFGVIASDIRNLPQLDVDTSPALAKLAVLTSAINSFGGRQTIASINLDIEGQNRQPLAPPSAPAAPTKVEVVNSTRGQFIQ